MTADRSDQPAASSKPRRRGILSTALLLLVCAIIVWLFAWLAFRPLDAIQRVAEEAGGSGASAREVVSDLIERLEGALERAGATRAPGESLVASIEELAERCGSGPEPVPCPEPARPCPSTERPREEFVVYFVLDSAELTPTKRETIARAAQLVQSCPGSRATVYGHTDRTGSPEHNEALSDRRAAVVAEELAALLGADVRQVARGQEEPADDVPGPSEFNRRAEIIVE